MEKLKPEDLDLKKVYPAPKSRKQYLEDLKSEKNLSIKSEEKILEVNIPAKIEKSVGPEMLACGHWNWYSQIEHEEARRVKKCCPGAGINGNPKFIPYLKREG
jgi:hypothetical protein